MLVSFIFIGVNQMHLLYPVYLFIDFTFSGDLLWDKERKNGNFFETGRTKISVNREKEREFKLRDNMDNRTVCLQHKVNWRIVIELETEKLIDEGKKIDNLEYHNKYLGFYTIHYWKPL